MRAATSGIGAAVLHINQRLYKLMLIEWYQYCFLRSMQEVQVAVCWFCRGYGCNFFYFKLLFGIASSQFLNARSREWENRGLCYHCPFSQNFQDCSAFFFVFYHTGICICSLSVIMICYSSADFCSISGAEQARVYPGGCY